MAYSTDLREKITRAYDDGLGSQRAIEARTQPLQICPMGQTTS